MDTARSILELYKLQGDPRAPRGPKPLEHRAGVRQRGAAELSGSPAVAGGHVPDLLSSLYVPGAEEGDAGEAQVLVGHEHPHGDEVGLAQVVDEAADVAIETGVDAVNLSILGRNGAGLLRGLLASTNEQALR